MHAAFPVGRYEITAGLVDNHGDVVTREHAAGVCGHDGEREVDAEPRVLKDPRNLALGELDISRWALLYHTYSKAGFERHLNTGRRPFKSPLTNEEIGPVTSQTGL